MTMLGKIRKVHFVGIGGIGMSGIAEVLLNLGFKVSGSDLKKTQVTERLERLGGRIFEGHAASNVQDAQVVVVSSAVPPGNPELLEAERLKVPVIARAEMLAELMRLKFCVAVAGAHGKTTVTSMIAVMLSQGGLDPTAVIGGRLDAFGSSARLGKGDLMVVEADESDRSFLVLYPSIAVVTNIDREHLDHYRNLEELDSAFVSFMNRVPFYGAVVACTDPLRATGEARLCSVLPRVRRRVVTYEGPTYRLRRSTSVRGERPSRDEPEAKRSAGSRSASRGATTCRTHLRPSPSGLNLRLTRVSCGRASSSSAAQTAASR